MKQIVDVLGLFLCAGLVIACGDTGTVESTPDVGLRLDFSSEDVSSVADASDIADVAPRLDAETCDCPGNQRCDGMGECFEPDACETPDDCLGTRVCKQGECTDGCRDNADCPGALACDTSTQACVETQPCVSDASCLDDRLCLDGSCADRCASDEDCGGTQTCIVATGRCMAASTCSAPEDCPGSQVCQDSECVNRCLEATDCPGSQSCDDGVCSEPAPCLRDVDCRGERVCVNEECTNPCMMDGCEAALMCDVTSGRCAEAPECMSDEQCFAGRRCDSGTCADPCAENADCPGSQRCDERGQCIESGSCQSDESCSVGRVCQNERCVDNCVTAGCSAELSCDELSGTCQEVAPCRRDEQCLSGRYCLEGVCTTGCVERTECPGALDCSEGRCVESGNCFGDAQCLMGRVCNDDLLCTDICTTELPCVGAQRCGPTGQCVESGTCVNHRDCLGARVCHPDANVCVDACTPGSCLGNQVCNESGYCSERTGCSGDGACLGDRVCRLGACRTLVCESTSDCGGNGICVDWSCVDTLPLACQCDAGRICQDNVCIGTQPCSAVAPCASGICEADGRCSQCVESADCPGSTQCQSGVCIESTACIADAACLAGRICDMDSGRCVNDVNCVDDQFEFHGIPSAAIPLTNQTYTGLRICIEEDDWFRFATDGMAQLVVRHAPTGVPLTLNVFAIEDETTVIDVSAGETGEAWVSVTQPGEYLVRIARPRGAPNEYSLQIREADCIFDAYEKPWQNDVATQAAAVGAQIVLGAICTNDTDWFVFNSGGSGALETRSDIEFVDQSGTPISQVTDGTPFRIVGEGAYAFEIVPIREPSLRCATANQNPVVLGVPQTLRFDALDDFADGCLAAGLAESVFAVDVPSEGQIEVRYEGDALMTTYGVYDDCDVEPLFCANGVGDNVSRTVDPGRYYVVVQGSPAGTVTINHIEALGCDDLDTVTIGDATPVSLGDRMEDFAGDCFVNGPNAMVRFTLDQMSRVSIGVSGTTGMPAQTGLALRRGCQDVASEFACVNGGTSLEADGLEPGDYTLLVHGAGPGTVQIDASPIVALGFENGCDGMPALLSSGDELTLTGQLDGVDEWFSGDCGVTNGAEQFLSFTLAESATVTASLSVEGTLAVLSGNCMQTLACGQASNPVVSSAPSLSTFLFPGSYTLVVDGVVEDFEASLSVQ